MVVVHWEGWEMIISEEVANNPEELAKVRATLKMLSEMELNDRVFTDEC